MSPTRFIPIAKLGKTFGIKGWLKIHSYTDPFDRLFDYSPLYIETKTGWEKLNIDAHRIQNDTIVAHIKDCNSPEEAQLFANKSLAISRAQMPALPQGEYYLIDLEGLTVINQKQIILGTVDYIFNTGSNDVMVVKGEKEHWLPYIKNEVILAVDLDKKIIQVEWDEDF